MGINKIKKIAIANRGEVAIRIHLAAQELGLQTVLLHSEFDSNGFAARSVDEKMCIGPSPSSESYLNIEANIRAAKACGADAIHPGFGFLSENAHFARACRDEKLIFIGPSPECIELFGSKVSAKNLVGNLGLPLIPGYSGSDQSLERLLKEAKTIGYPVIVKASDGGGGRGLKVVHKEEDLKAAVESAEREGLSAFGSSKIFLEKYLDRAQHIEVQIFGDASGRVRHLFERNCSVQRRHQKIIEEARSPNLDENLRDKICQAAVQIGEAAKYKSAGTVEFLVQDGSFYFMEVNTRLQVEHPVTELVMGVDLVKAQIVTAMEAALVWPDEFRPRGHSIECRIYAEDPYLGGIPSTGRLGLVHFPNGPFRRFDVGVESGDEVGSFYDSMIGKIIVWDETRVRAIQKMRQTLSETIIFGLRTNIPLLQKILAHPEFVEGKMTTRFFETHFSKPLEEPSLSVNEKKALGQLWSASDSESATTTEKSPWFNDWSARG